MNRRAKINRKNVANHLMKYQLSLIDKSLDDAFTDDWEQWTITQEQYDEFRRYAIGTLKKVFKFNTNKAKATFDWFYNHFGLTIKEIDNEQTN